MRIVLLMTLILLLGFTACRNNDINQPTTGTVELIFIPQYEGAPMVFFADTDANTNGTLYFQRLEFFISELKLQQGNQTVDLSEVEYMNMNDLITPELAQQGVSLTFDEVPNGTYDQLLFGVGVTDANNSKEPADFSTSSALGRTGNYWSSWSSYIFCKIEGRYTPSGGSTNPFLYHAGVNGMYQPRSLSKAITVKGGETTQVMIYLKGEELFFKSGATIDLVNENATHSGAQGSSGYNLSKQMMINLANSLQIQ